MSLASYASPFLQSTSTGHHLSSSSSSSRVKSHTKTQKSKHFDLDKQKVQSILEKIHQRTNDSDASDDDNDDNDDNNNEEKQLKQFPPYPQLNKTSFQHEQFDLNDIRNYGDSKSTDEYYRRILPGYKESMSTRQRQQQHQAPPTHDTLIKLHDLFIRRTTR